MLWRIDVTCDRDEVHSKIICYKCKNKISHSKRIKDDVEKILKFQNEQDLAKSLDHLWVPHIENECKVCQISSREWYDYDRKSVRSNISKDETIDLSQIFEEKTESKPEKAVDFMLEIPEKSRCNYICSICQDIFSLESVRSKCKHYFCIKCISNLFEFSKINVSCPICSENICEKDLEKADFCFESHIKNCPVSCNKCKTMTNYESIENHTCKTENDSHDP